MSRAWTRRELLKWGLGSVASSAALEGLAQIGRVPGWHPLLGGSAMPHPDWWMRDSYDLTRSLSQQGSFAQLASVLQLQQAFAQSTANDWSIITIKVMAQVHQPLVFAFGEIDANDKLAESNGVGQVRTAMGTQADGYVLGDAMESTKKHLVDGGVKSLSRDRRLSKLRFNEWFGSRLMNGSYDGLANGDRLSFSSLLGQFPADVAIQAGLCTMPIAGPGVHQLRHAALRDDLPDLCFYAANKGLIQSPLGITCMMMGDFYDAASDLRHNVVFSGFSTADKGKITATGRRVTDIVRNVKQSFSSYADERPLETGNFTYLLDKLVTREPKIRKGLQEYRSSLRTLINDLESIAQAELQPIKASIGVEANKQANFNGTGYDDVPAKNEFLSQCALVSKSLQLPGQPYRNFSLFLNLNDLDGTPIDVAKNGDVSFKTNSLNYVEGMRQLALGLNMLGRAISGKKALVVVVADGGRGARMGDGFGGSFSLLLGPMGSGMLDDQLHGPMPLVNSNNIGVFSNFGGVSTTDPVYNWSTGDSTWGLYGSNGVRLPSSQCNSGDWQVGVLDFLCQKMGKSEVMTPSLGSFVRFKRKA